MISDIEKTLLQFLDQRNIADTSILVAYSGGVDSSVLLHALNEIKTRSRITLVACHINHSLRGEESNQDALFCHDFCKERGISFFEARADVLEYANKNKISIELAGRDVRKNILADKARQINCRFIFLAHHENDQIETLLFRLFRGTGLHGMQGIQSFFLKDSLYWCRPFLETPKEDLLHYAESKHIQWRTDSSNNTLDYSRNIIRNEIVPVILNHFKSFPCSILKFQRLARGLTEEINALLPPFYHETCFYKPGHLFVFLDKLKDTMPHIFGEVLRTYLNKSGLSSYLPDYDFCLKIYELMNKSSGNRFNLSSGLTAIKDRGWIHIFSSHSENRISVTIKTEIMEDCDTFLSYKEAGINLYKDLILNKIMTFVYALKTHFLNSEIEIKKNDTLNLNQTRLAGKSLKNLFSEKKTPYSLINSIPLVFLNNELILIPGIAGDPRYITSHGKGIKITYNSL